jgi:hypothetical protein
VTLTVTILKAGLRLPGHRIVLTAREGLKQTPAPCLRDALGKVFGQSRSTRMPGTEDSLKLCQ